MASNLRVDSIVPATGGSVSIGTATGGVSIPGVLTYEDVTNVDSVGVITARSGIRIGATGANTLITGNGVGIGIGITTPQEELHIRAATPVIRLEDGDNARQSQIVGSDGNLRLDADNGNAIADTNIAFRTDGGERLRIGPVGQIGIGGANYGTSGQVLTSQGSGSAVQWATPAVTGGNMFIAKMNSGYNTSNNTDGEIVFQNEVFDSDGTYNNSNGRFTPNVAGYYFIDASLQFSTNSANNNFESTIWKNGTEQFVNRMRNPAANTELHCKVSGIVSVNGSSDYISIAAWQNSGGNLTVNPGNGSYFMGFFLRSL